MNANLQSSDSTFPNRQPVASHLADSPPGERRCVDIHCHRRYHRYPLSTVSGIASTTSTTNTTSPTKKRCRVHFGDARVVAILKPASSMSHEERDVIWYAQMHLDDMKVEARRLCRSLRTRNSASGNSPLPHACTDSSSSIPAATTPTSATAPLLLSPTKQSLDVGLVDDGGSPSRGLEQRACHTRQRNKYLAIRCILKAQRKSRCPDLISRISSQCTEWARQLARDEATKDFCEVYYPHLASQVEVGGAAARNGASTTSVFPFHLQRTRQQPGSTEGGSTTRQLLGQQDCMDRSTRQRLN